MLLRYEHHKMIDDNPDVIVVHHEYALRRGGKSRFTIAIRMLDEDPSNELIVGEEMNHVYPLFPIPEAKPAVDKIVRTMVPPFP